MGTHKKLEKVFGKARRIHLVGVKGVGMTALAQILNATHSAGSGRTSSDFELTASDTKKEFFTDAVLKREKIKVKNFSARNISRKIDLVISSGAYFFDGKVMGNNVEIKKALKLKLPILTYPQAMALIAKDYKVIAVAGSHGKSTTSAMLGWALDKAGKSPNVVVGSMVRKWGSNAKINKKSVFPRQSSGQNQKKEFLILEADEYREAFLNYRPHGVIVTNIDYDHPDYYKNKTSYYRAFKRLIDRIEKGGWLIGFGDDVEVQTLLKYGKSKGLKVLSYGFSKKNDLILEDKGMLRRRGRDKFAFSAEFHNKIFKGSISFPGKHHIANAGAVLVTAKFLLTPIEKMLQGIDSFPGIARRFEILRKRPAVIIDDYAHHPSEIRATLEGLREMYPKKNIIAIFQPHMFSRTEKLMGDFAQAFSSADEVGIMEIFSSARESKGKVSSKDLVEAMSHQHPKVRYLGQHKTAKKFLESVAKNSSNVIILMGAGDLYKIAK